MVRGRLPRFKRKRRISSLWLADYAAFPAMTAHPLGRKVAEVTPRAAELRASLSVYRHKVVPATLLCQYGTSRLPAILRKLV